MATTTGRFASLLRAAGLTDLKVVGESGGCDVWQAQVPNAFGRTLLHVLHLGADAKWSDSRDVITTLKRVGGSHEAFYAVAEQSSRLLTDKKRVGTDFRVAKVLTRREFLGNAIAASASEAARASADDDLGPFIDPKLALPTKAQYYAVKYLSEWLRGGKTAKSSLGVVVADAGIGKTTLARHLRQHLLKTGSGDQLPFLIESSHWKKLADTPDLNLWDIWKQSLSVQAMGIAVEDTFNACISEGILLPIFDGFDELCSLRNRQFRVEATIQNLLELVESGPGRIIMTTRAGYWDTNVDLDLRSQCTQFDLLPFEKAQRDKFFEVRFPTNFAARKRAKKLADKVQAELYERATEKYPTPTERPTAVPAILELIASSVDDPSTDAAGSQLAKDMGENALQAVLLLLCERERLRQGLHATPEEQLGLFAELAIEGSEMLPDSIEIYAAGCCSAFEDESQRKLLFAPHPLIVEANGAYVFRFDFLRDFLRAFWLAANWNQAKQQQVLAAFLEEHTTSDTAVFEYLATRMLSDDKNVKWTKLIASAIKSMETLGKRKAVGALWSLSTVLFNRSSGSPTKADRTRQLLELFGDPKGRRFQGLNLRGRIAAMDLSGIGFDHCFFENLVFFGCDFDSESSITNTSFIGDFRLEGCRHTELMSFSNAGLLSPEARESLLKAGVGGGAALLNRDAIHRVFRLALQKFVHGGAFHAIDVDHRNRGPLGHSPLNEDVWNALMKAGVVAKHTISGVGKDRGLGIEKDHQHEVRQFIDNAIVSGAVSQAVGHVTDAHRLV